MADTLKWGDGWGCAFATEKCLSAQNDEHFCREKQHESCTFDRSAVGCDCPQVPAAPMTTACSCAAGTLLCGDVARAASALSGCAQSP